MKIAISSTGRTFDDSMDPRFGRCRYFVLVETKSLELEAIENPGLHAPGGAGPMAAQILVDRAVEVVITGACGPKAYQALQAAGIKLFIGAAGKVKDVLGKYKSSILIEAAGPTTPQHAGMS